MNRAGPWKFPVRVVSTREFDRLCCDVVQKGWLTVYVPNIRAYAIVIDSVIVIARENVYITRYSLLNT